MGDYSPGTILYAAVVTCGFERHVLVICPVNSHLLKLWRVIYQSVKWSGQLLFPR